MLRRLVRRAGGDHCRSGTLCSPVCFVYLLAIYASKRHRHSQRVSLDRKLLLPKNVHGLPGHGALPACVALC